MKRAVLIEAGHRCAIPTCKAVPVEFAHIVPWAQVQGHTFDNLIALCPTCHRRYDNGDIDRVAMRQYKANLAVVNSRYGDLEQRILEAYAEDPENGKTFMLHATSLLHVRYLLRDGLIADVATATPSTRMTVEDLKRFATFEMYHMFMITEEGAKFAQRWRDAQSLA
ncbi:HNH endonuclease [Actinacidiphila oryziradicis]|nr:HNH endonuclease signature motif containing protein [Actinacidiphila oryziradicis]